MVTSLITLLVSLGCPHARAEGLAADVAHVATYEAPLFSGKHARMRTARVLATWAWYESSGLAHVMGDGGQACGVLQLHPMARYGRPCDLILGDRRLGLALGLRFMRDASARCGGSVRAGLVAFASGKCSGVPIAERLVDRRLHRAGAR